MLFQFLQKVHAKVHQIRSMKCDGCSCQTSYDEMSWHQFTNGSFSEYQRDRHLDPEVAESSLQTGHSESGADSVQCFHQRQHPLWLPLVQWRIRPRHHTR